MAQEETGQVYECDNEILDLENEGDENIEDKFEKQQETDDIAKVQERSEIFAVEMPEIVVRQTAGQTLLMPVTFNGLKMDAIVDTAAMVTLADYSLFTEHQLKTSCDKMKLKGIGNQEVEGTLIKDVEISIGRSRVYWDVCATHLADKILLGLDFLSAQKGVLNFKENTMTISDEEIPLKLVEGNKDLSISRVIVPETVVVPPNSVIVIPVKIEASLEQDYVIEPYIVNTDILISASIGRGPTGQVNVVNDSNHSVKLKQGKCIGKAETVEEILEHTEIPTLIRQTKLESISKEVSELPAHLTELFEKSANHLNEEQKMKLKQTLIEFQDVFAKHDLDLGCLTTVTHKIDTGNSSPVKLKMRRTPIGFQEAEEKQLNKMLEAGVIRPSTSDWASVPVLIRKKDNSVRWCLDYRLLNSKTVKDRFPLPIIEDCLDTLQGNKFFNTLDLCSGYYQIKIEETDCKKTAFTTRYGLFEHTRMGMGLCNAPATFQRAMQLVLRGLLWTEVLVYIDDVIVLGKDFEEALQHLRHVFQRLRDHNLKLKPRKCELFQQEVLFLGKLVNEKGISIAPSKIEAVTNWPVPTNAKNLMSFLGFANYHRDHIKYFADLSFCLYELAHSTGEFLWLERHQEAFQNLKKALTSAPCLVYPMPEGEFILDTDASHNTIGAVLSQIQDGEVKVICYASHALLKPQRKYCTTRKELLAVVKFCRHFRHYLLGRRFTLRTDHNSLVWLMRFKHIEGQLARWLEELAQFDMEIIHRPGKFHGNADGMSRIPDTISECNCYEAGENLEKLPCGGCRYCTRALLI